VRKNKENRDWRISGNRFRALEEIITGQDTLIDYPKKIRTLAKRYARKIIREQACVIDAGEEILPDYATIDLNSLEDEDVRTVGAEYVVYETIKELGIDQKLMELGLNRHQVGGCQGCCVPWCNRRSNDCPRF